MLYEKLAALPQRKYTYRFVLAPETIGSIAYLSKHGEALKEKLQAGWVLTCCGDAGKIHYKNSRRGNALVDRISKHILNQLPLEWNDLEFSVGGSDERQFCSPGYNLPIGSFMRTPYQRYAQYHTSLDNRDFISLPAMEEGVEILFQMVLALEINDTYEAVVQYGEPQLGKRGLYPSSNLPNTNQRQMVHNMMHLINWSDGEHDLLSIAEKKGTAMFYFAPLAKLCEEKGVLRRK
jgi:aminopeptidase-like protein